MVAAAQAFFLFWEFQTALILFILSLMVAAPTLATFIQIIASQFFRPKTTTTAVPLAPPPTVQIDLLRARLYSIRTKISERSHPPAPEIVNLIDRLDKLIDKTNQEEPFIE